MKFAILITGAPYSSQAPQTALSFCEAARKRGDDVIRVFLYGDGVHLANALSTPPSDEANWYRRWSDWLERENVEAVVCVASALRRGLIDEREAGRYEKAHFNVTAPWQIAGLGELVSAGNDADRLIHFGPA